MHTWQSQFISISKRGWYQNSSDSKRKRPYGLASRICICVLLKKMCKEQTITHHNNEFEGRGAHTFLSIYLFIRITVIIASALPLVINV